ncbi:MAG: NgoFVII family restriction endonuclease [Planctomycetes bacterium]|nr:NgoFVII family restriction endonuclease [Planctomycetota bacterium]
MPRIFDNIESQLLPVLQETLERADRADFCVGYFNLRGWRHLCSQVEGLRGGDGHCCRLLVGMHIHPREQLKRALRLTPTAKNIDNQTALKIRKEIAEDFRAQLAMGAPTNRDESTLRRLAAQIKAKKVVVKLFLRHPLHAKMYLLFRSDPINPRVGYLGSSNLTFAGLARQGELNVDVLDHDACEKLAKWFEERWNDHWCIDISKDLVEAIEASWASEQLIPPYHIYLKVAYHLSQEARAGLSEFRIPKDFGKELFEFQTAAVKMGAHHVNKRGGVLIGDVVGLGKTLMATALARVLQDDFQLETLIICPKNLTKMWQDYKDRYRMIGEVLSISRVMDDLRCMHRFRVVIIDESHELRNREGKRYRAIRDYIQKNDCKCILLSATPYNKDYRDLSNQLRLFVPDEMELSIRPEKLLRELGETEFARRYQCLPRSLAGFEKSDYPDDWRDVMRLYMVRRTRSFIIDNYADTEDETGRKYLTFEDGSRSYFPDRIPKTLKFAIDDKDPEDQYARLYSPKVVDAINKLTLPRYGLANYLEPDPHKPPTQAQQKVIGNLTRAGKRLMGFCRSGLFKRLESSGHVFLQSVRRHILRNYVFLHAIDNGEPLPIGSQDVGLFVTTVYDRDAEAPEDTTVMFDVDDEDNDSTDFVNDSDLIADDDFRRIAANIYAEYATKRKRHFNWLPADFFGESLAEDLHADAQILIEILQKYGNWDPAKDTKLFALHDLLSKRHPEEKVIVFTQYADTADYLAAHLKKLGISNLAGVTGDSSDPTSFAWRFSPVSNKKRDRIVPADELRVLIATDVLSEGQNLQDAYIVVNYDLPWAIVRLIQRVGRVDRIGQDAEQILCYSFLPADGVERIIRLRSRIEQRLSENAEVVGTDEAFFEGDVGKGVIVDLYNEKGGILDVEDDSEVDLASQAYQIWKNAIKANPKLEKIVPALPNVVHSTKLHTPGENEPEGAIVYLKTAADNDALIWIDKNGDTVTESQHIILKSLECKPDTPALPRRENHYELVKKGVDIVVAEEQSIGGGLGRPSGARFRTYERLKHFAEANRGTLFDFPGLDETIEDIYRYPLRQVAKDTLNRQLRTGIEDDELARLAIRLREEGRLHLIEKDGPAQEPQIICSMGLSQPAGEL